MLLLLEMYITQCPIFHSDRMVSTQIRTHSHTSVAKHFKFDDFILNNYDLKLKFRLLLFVYLLTYLPAKKCSFVELLLAFSFK